MKKNNKKIDSELRASIFSMCAWISLFFVSVVNLIRAIFGDRIPKPVYLVLAGIGFATAIVFIVCWLRVRISIRNRGTDSSEEPIQEDTEEELQEKSQKR